MDRLERSRPDSNRINHRKDCNRALKMSFNHKIYIGILLVLSLFVVISSASIVEGIRSGRVAIEGSSEIIWMNDNVTNAQQQILMAFGDQTVNKRSGGNSAVA